MTHTDLLRQAADTIEAMWDRHSGGKLNIDAASSSFIHRAQLTLAALRAALAQPAPAVPDMQPLPNHDNHHNALLCPYCNPRKLKFAEPDAAPAVPIYGKYTADDLVRGVVESAAPAVRDEIELIEAVLAGYPPSMARSDALRACRVLRGIAGDSK